MNEMNMNLTPDYRTSTKHICPCCCGPLRIQDVDPVTILLWCPSPKCKYGDITEGHAASELAFYGVQAPTEDLAFDIMETKMAAMPERMPPDNGYNEDGGTDR